LFGRTDIGGMNVSANTSLASPPKPPTIINAQE